MSALANGLITLTVMVSTAAAAQFATDVPVELDRDEARGLARAELANPIYDDKPSLLERAVEWVLEQIGKLFAAASDVSPGGWVGVGILAALLVIGWLVIRRKLGPLTRSARTHEAVFDETRRSADEHRSAADEAAAAGDFSRAVIERFRGIVRGLEERDLLDIRPGRTVGEVVHDASRSLPAAEEQLVASGRIFADVRYGDRVAGIDHDVRLRSADAAIAAARPAAASGEAAEGNVPSTRVALPR